MNKSRAIIVGTRGSSLALAQTQGLVDALKKYQPGLEVEIRKITTSGDRIQNRFLAEVGGKGLFVKEIEEALLKNDIDLAIHSLKDLPAQLPKDLTIGCYPKRIEPWDVLVTADGLEWSKLKPKAILGTSSLRRRSQLNRLRPDIRFEILRGNIDSRLRKLGEGKFDAIVLALAGMKRLGLETRKAFPLPIVPAPGQGTLALEIRRADRLLKEMLAPLHHLPTQWEAEAERFVMKALGGDCDLPLGVLARAKGVSLTLKAYIGLPDGSEAVVVEQEGAIKNHIELAEDLLNKMSEQGSEEILEACRSQ